MPHSLMILNQSGYLIHVVDINSDIKWQTVQIQKPTDLDLYCFQRQGISELSRTRGKSLTDLPVFKHLQNP